MHQVKKLPKSEVEITITVDEQALLAAKEAAYRKLSPTVVVPGFRPGRAPREKIEAVMADRLASEATKIAIQKSLSDVIVDDRLAPLDVPRITIDQFDGKALSFRAQFTVRPDVKIGNYKKLKVKTTKIKDISEDDVEKSIQRIYESWAEKQAKQPAGGQSPFAPKELRRGKPNDDFARAIGAGDMDNLRELVKKDMEDIARSNAQIQDEKNILDALLAICETEVPDIFIEDEVSRLVARTSADLSSSGVKLAEWLMLQDKTPDQLRKDLTEQAERNVKIQLILAQLARQESITAANDEIDRELAKFSQAEISPPAAQSMKDYIAHAIIQTKALDFLKKQLAI